MIADCGLRIADLMTRHSIFALPFAAHKSAIRNPQSAIRNHLTSPRALPHLS